MSTILILTSKTGGGHVSLAEALRDQLEDDYTVELVDPQSRFFHFHYRLVSRYALWLWSAEFRWTDTPRKALFAHRISTRLVAKQLLMILNRTLPDLIISTYPFFTYEVMQLLRRHSSTIPFVMLFSDPNGVHASWLTESNATATFATTRETYAQALSAAFDPERLHLVGWPVRGQFYRATLSQRAETLNMLGLEPERFTIFLQGGGEGAAQVGCMVERILGISQHLQVILATGTNEALRRRFSNLRNLYVLPFTKEIAPFMAASDVIMGKAGPNTLFESVILGKPFIATTYIPGQEEANLDFILHHKLGWVALEPEEQQTLLSRLVSDTSALDAMKATVEAYGQWNSNATKEIRPLVEALLAKRHLFNSSREWHGALAGQLPSHR